ncbi:hypothetical protein [Clavibacter zhangzhiyongii]|uniref:hypothetical protein n=1 Tax=Clavibacter zhangzhiyongii TaxID=2768071 RepID=UPI001958CAD4|nr:hypothetical protein [Clavibacter zhangzhiyongii]MBM7026929.1 hypothetical protein [Clavibacter zhangzhiyongii]
MEIMVALLSVLAAFVIPIYLHRQNHPRREIRYAVSSASAEDTQRNPTAMRLAVWSTGRADIPSTQFDGKHPITFHFSNPVAPLRPAPRDDPAHPWEPAARTNQEFVIPARLIQRDFRAEFVFVPLSPFHVTVLNPLVDIRILRDVKAEDSPPATQERAIDKSRARAHVSLLSIAAWVTVVSFLLVVVGVAVTGADKNLGAGIGGPGLLLFPVGHCPPRRRRRPPTRHTEQGSARSACYEQADAVKSRQSSS